MVWTGNRYLKIFLRNIKISPIKIILFIIADAGLEHLKGVHTIDLSWCKRITDAGLALLQGVHTINLWNCELITDAGLAH